MKPGDIVFMPHRWEPVGICNQPINESAPLCKHADAVVAEARRLVASGMSRRGAALRLGLASTTVDAWFWGSRPVPTKYALRPLKT